MAGAVDPYELGADLEQLQQLEGLEQLSEIDTTELEELDTLELSQIGVTANLHQLSVEVGYQWYSPENVILRLSAGAAVTLSARSRVRMDDIVYEEWTVDTEPYQDEASRSLDQALRRYFHTPTVGLAVGYRFR